MATPKKPRNPDHVRRHTVPSPDTAALTARLTDLLHPAVFSQLALYRSLGLRNRILGLPLMVACVLTLLWRQVPGVCELTRLLAREDLLWAKATRVTQQALSERFLSFPYQLFQAVLFAVLPRLQARWLARTRPVPPAVATAMCHFPRIWIVDGSTLEALFRKLDSLRVQPPGVLLAGKICTIIDLASRLPQQLFYTTASGVHDTQFGPQLRAFVPAGTLLVCDRGFYDFGFFDALIAQHVAILTRLKSNAHFGVQAVLQQTPAVVERIIVVTTETDGVRVTHTPLRLIEACYKGQWYRYITSVLDPAVLPAAVVVELYRQRWRIEESFLFVKRVLGLAYLWVGSENGVLLQVWATWLFYAVLLDLGDAVAEELARPFDDLSLEMVFRGIYHYSVAAAHGKADDLVKYLAAAENADLGVVKRKHPPLREAGGPRPPPAHQTQRAAIPLPTDLTNCESA
jgi:Transposase DDE domain